MGWVLWALTNSSPLADTLVLKGGNSLRKAYFPDTRFSDDLDFTARAMPTEMEFRDELNRICETVRTVAGIPFRTEMTRAEEKGTPDPDSSALDGRVYFEGFAGDASLTMRVKFDVSDFEVIALPPIERPMIHAYSDHEECATQLLTYQLEEILAEKLRSWIQRTRSRDLFDAVKIIREHGEEVHRRRVLDAFLRKTIFKGIPRAGRDELLVGEKFIAASEHWLRTIICPKNAFIAAAAAIELFRDFVEALFALPALQQAGYASAPPRTDFRRFASGLRETLIAAGRRRETVLMTYDGKEREIEPYSFRYRIRQSDGMGVEYFYGFDRTRGNTIKSFIVDKIASVRGTGRTFMPRYVVEF